MRSYSQVDIENSLRRAGLSTGDIVFVTTSLGMLGIAEGADSLEELGNLHLAALRNVLGEQGTILVPTYSYSFGGSSASEYAVFDPATTPSKIGPFPEFFRQQPGVIRSLDPMMSVAGLGPQAKELLENLPPSSYGEGCLFARLAETSAKCCSIGLGPNWTPFIHHVDWLSGAEFRFDKLFRGLTKIDGLLRETSWIYSVAVLCPEADPNGHVIGNLAVEAGIWRYAPLGRARVYLCSYRQYFDFALRCAKENPWVTAVGPPTKVLELERRRVPPRKAVWSGSEVSASTVDLYHRLASLSRDEVSDGADDAFSLIDKCLSLKLHRFGSGQNHFDWVIPEKWDVQDAILRDSSGTVLWSLGDGRDRVYSYSLAVSETVDRNTLDRHLRIGSTIERPQISCSTNRDWGFCCTAEEALRLDGNEFQVEIISHFSYGEMLVGDHLLEGAKADCILVVSYLSGTGPTSSLLGAVSAVSAAKALGARCNLETSVRFLWVTSPAGFAAWINTQYSIDSRILGVVELDDIERDSICIRHTGDISALSPVLHALCNELEATTVAVPHQAMSLYAVGGNPCATQHPGMVPLESLSFGDKTSPALRVSRLSMEARMVRLESVASALALACV